MAAYKQFSTNDVVINPFLANKGFNLTGSAITSSNLGVDIFQGINPSGSTRSELASPTGLISIQNTTGIYNSVKQLYYSNYLTRSLGDFVPTASIIPGSTAADTVAFGQAQSPRYENYLQSTLTQSRNFPTGVGNSLGDITVVSIPQKLFGENIVPSSFELKYTSSSGYGFGVSDDGNGNLILNTISGSSTGYGGAIYGAGAYGAIPSEGLPGTIIGQIFYSHGIAVFTTSSLTQMGSEISSSTSQLEDFKVGFTSSITIYEHQYKCIINENEFGFSQNPSIISQSLDATGSLNDVYYDFATGSVFDPYITTVGLYTNDTELVAVGKLSYPVPVSKFCDTIIQVNFDT